MSFTLKFSDPTKTASISVPDMPPGINIVDTSLNLVGRGYPNYSQKTAENFLHLLENFAGPNSPQNPVEGQLWYDTSDPSNKVLRIMNGTSTSARWPNVTGIYQQTVDPKSSPSIILKSGDIWVDTLLNQLKIYANSSWVVVGPSLGTGGSRTGTESAIIEDINGASYPVIFSYVQGKIISIISAASFIPNPVISGFTSLSPGINLVSDQSAIVAAIAESAMGLNIDGTTYDGSTFLRKDDGGYDGQIITGKVVFQTSGNTNAAQGRDGLLVNNSTDSTAYLQLYKYNSDAILLNNSINGKIIFRTKSSTGTAVYDTIVVQKGVVGINTTTSVNSPNLDVNGTARISGNLSLTSTSTTTLMVSGGISVSNGISVGGNSHLLGSTTSTGILTVGTPSGAGEIIMPANTGTYDIGTVSKYFRSIYASEIHTSKINGSAVSVPGTVVSFAGSGAPPGWLLCNGSNFSVSDNPGLFSVIGYKYGGSAAYAKVPNMSTSTFISTGTSTGTYLSYIIKL